MSHGNNAQLNLGNTSLTQDNLAIYQDDLITWRQGLNEDADILLYGCNLVENASGLNFVQELSGLTNADIAASNDLTGSSLMGGNWLLETTVGTVETSSIVASNYGFVFATYNGNEYQLTTRAYNWQQAQAQAQALGGNLVTINSAAEQQWLENTFGTTERYWTGLNDSASEGNFVWASGETANYTNFLPFQPDDYRGREDYIVMNWRNNGQWNDVPAGANFVGII